MKKSNQILIQKKLTQIRLSKNDQAQKNNYKFIILANKEKQAKVRYLKTKTKKEPTNISRIFQSEQSTTSAFFSSENSTVGH